MSKFKFLVSLFLITSLFVTTGVNDCQVPVGTCNPCTDYCPDLFIDQCQTIKQCPTVGICSQSAVDACIAAKVIAFRGSYCN